MENKGKMIDKILKDFITEETKATDMRILSIRHFLATLNKAVDKYLEESEDTYENEENGLLQCLTIWQKYTVTKYLTCF